MKSFYSDSCLHNQHALCRDQNCQCGCHTLKIEAEALDNFLGKFVATEVN